jgi:hypothetical protein
MAIMQIRDLFNRFIQPPAVPSHRFGRWLQLIAELDETLPEVQLSEPERETLGGYLLPDGPAIAGLTARAIPPECGDLADRQVRACGYLVLQRALLALADRAGQLHLLEQAAATRQAIALLKDAREAARGRFAGPADHARLRALALPAALLRLWHRRTERGRKK